MCMINGYGNNVPIQDFGGGSGVCLSLKMQQAFEQLCQRLHLKHVKQRAQISHSFTHFTWQLEALCFQIDADLKEHLAIELNAEWHSPQQAGDLGIPTAMKKLISAINL